jgi:acetylornithine deacetylase/succinyl-diaminopimelate desuccinylase-like protein
VTFRIALAFAFAFAFGVDASPGARPASFASPDPLARAILKQLVEIDTTHGTTGAAEAMATRLREAGLPKADVQLVGPTADKRNLVARLRGTGKRRPLLLLAHLDVVAALAKDWSPRFPPFRLTEEDGYFYGRGASDDKSLAAAWVTLLIHLEQQGPKLDRDLIVALTADEEGGDHNGVRWLLAEHKELLDAELCLNEGGGGDLRNGRPLFNGARRCSPPSRCTSPTKGGTAPCRCATTPFMRWPPRSTASAATTSRRGCRR